VGRTTWGSSSEEVNMLDKRKGIKDRQKFTGIWAFDIINMDIKISNY
jgi:hypothetical protein